jgi:hypothetical protein
MAGIFPPGARVMPSHRRDQALNPLLCAGRHPGRRRAPLPILVTSDRHPIARVNQPSTVCASEPERLERSGSVRYEGSWAVRAALGRRNPYERIGAGRYGTDSLTLWSGSLWRMQQVLRTKGHRAVSYGFELPDHQESERDCLRGRTADTSPFGEFRAENCRGTRGVAGGSDHRLRIARM